MDLQTALNNILSHKYTNDDLNQILDYVASNKIRYNTFVIFLQILDVLNNDGQKEFINEFIKRININRFKSTRVFNLLFDQTSTEQNDPDSIFRFIDWKEFSLEELNCILEIFRKYLPEDDLKIIKFNYSEVFCELPEEELDNLQSFKITNVEEDDYDAYIRKLGGSKKQIIKEIANEILLIKPEILVSIHYYDGIYDDYTEYKENVICNGILLVDLIEINKIIKECNLYSKDFDFSDAAYMAVSKSEKILNLNPRLTERIAEEVKKIISKNPKYAETNGEILLSSSLNDEEIIRIIDTIDQIDRKDVKYIIESDLANKYYDKLSLIKNTDNIFIDFGGDSLDENMTLEEYKKAHKFYDGIASFINRFELSPVEKYLFAYDLTRQFKKYKFYGDDEELDKLKPKQSRDSFIILKNDYIVCAGFANFLNEVLKRLNISSKYLVLTCQDAQNTELNNRETHARVMVHLKDEKYNIDGIYVGDPTFDNHSIGFSHAFMTKTKEELEKDDGLTEKQYITNFNELTNIGASYFNEMMDRRISTDIIAYAISNMYKITNSHLSDHEILQKINDALIATNILSINEETYDLPIKYVDSKIMWMMLSSTIGDKKIQVYSTGSQNGVHNFLIYINCDDEMLSKYVNTLFYYKNAYENEHVKFEFNKYNNKPGINIKLSENYTLRQLKEIYDKAVMEIKNILIDNSLINDTSLESESSPSFK